MFMVTAGVWMLWDASAIFSPIRRRTSHCNMFYWRLSCCFLKQKQQRLLNKPWNQEYRNIFTKNWPFWSQGLSENASPISTSRTSLRTCWILRYFSWIVLSSRKLIVNSCPGAEEQDHVIMFSHMKTLSTLDVLGFKNVAVMFLASRNIIFWNYSLG
jgi:hypothetical protein